MRGKIVTIPISDLDYMSVRPEIDPATLTRYWAVEIGDPAQACIELRLDHVSSLMLAKLIHQAHHHDQKVEGVGRVIFVDGTAVEMLEP